MNNCIFFDILLVYFIKSMYILQKYKLWKKLVFM